MATLGYNDLRKGVVFDIDGAPYEVTEYAFVRMQQRKAVAQVKMKNWITGKVLSRNFHQSEYFEEADIERKPIKFLYSNRGEFWFAEKNDPSKRFSLTTDVLGPSGLFLKPNADVTAVLFNGATITVDLPIKVDLVVKDAPPGERGNTAQGGMKLAELETGAKVNVPLFVNTGDVVRINTETCAYVERVEKK
jgi:elongation factor P